MNHTHQLVTGLNAMHMAARYGSWQSLGWFETPGYLRSISNRLFDSSNSNPSKDELLMAGARSDIKTYAKVRNTSEISGRLLI